ncbi:hypothetical protein ACIBG8_00730 [Nonomuraea sp. NPDC050556]|uniref:hypothetical protein n=1 Tax=Nonomuraea sp. NPDC050556 TaxID=3364369 RepID=UPI00379E849E
MTHRVLLASLAAGALTVPLPLSYALGSRAPAGGLAIKEILVRPENPVVRATGSVRLVIDVVARGASGRDGVTIKVEPGSPPKSAAHVEPVEGGKTFGPVPVEPPTPSATPSASPSVSPSVSSPAVMPPVSPPPSPGAVASSPGAATPGPASPSPAFASPLPSAVEVASPGSSAVQDDGWSVSYPARLGGEGWETWRFLPARGLNRYYPSGAWTITATAADADGRTVTEHSTFYLRRETQLSSVRADKVKGARAVRLRGELSRVDPEGYRAYAPFPRQRLEILYRAAQTASWTEVGTAVTRGSGRFMTTIQGRAKGYWRVRYPGTNHYATDLTTPWRIGR